MRLMNEVCAQHAHPLNGNQEVWAGVEGVGKTALLGYCLNCASAVKWGPAARCWGGGAPADKWVVVVEGGGSAPEGELGVCDWWMECPLRR